MADQTTPTGRPKREPTLLEALTPIVCVVLFLGLGYGLLGVRTEILLILTAVVTGAVGWRLGYSWKEMQEGIVDSISKAMPAMLIVITVGALIASWLVSGTIPYVVYHGLQLISPVWFLVTAYILCSIVSVMVGTSWGTIGTVGLALVGIADGMGVSLAATAGAVVAGAYFGDKLSPFSDTTNLAPIAARANLYDHIGHMVWTTTPAWLAGMAVYVFVGRGQAATVDSEMMSGLLAAIDTHFHLSPILLLPALITLGAAIFKKPVIPSMLLSIFVAFLLAVFTQETTDAVIGAAGTYEQGHAMFVRISKTLITGLQAATEDPSLNNILGRGGMLSMMDTLLIALCAFAFAGIAERARMLDVLLRKLARVAKTTGQLVAATVASCLTIAGITGNSYLSILVPGELFASEYKKRGLAAKNLSRTLEDSGTVVVPLIPWSISAVFITNTLGVSPLDYAPWAVNCYLGFVVALIYGFTGFRIAPRKNEDETQPGS